MKVGWDFLADKVRSSSWIKDNVKLTTVSLIDDVSKKSRLVVLRIYDAGIGKETNGCDFVNFTYQYAGFVDLGVDLEKTVVITNQPGSYVVRFNGGIVPSHAYGLNFKRPELDEAGCKIGKAIIDGENHKSDMYTKFSPVQNTNTTFVARFLGDENVKKYKYECTRNLSNYQAEAIMMRARNPECIKKAQELAEKRVADMLSPIVGDKARIHFEWPPEEKQN